MVVFDFDKTLTYHDTLYGFYREADGKNIFFPVKRIALIFSAVLYKTGLISNDLLKEIGIALFLKGKSRNEIDQIAKRYVRKIEFNKIYKGNYLETPQQNRMIVTASFEEYIGILLPTEWIVASKLSYKENKVTGLERNMYKTKKKSALLNLGIDKIERFYTDSESDSSVMELSEKVFMVSGDQIKEK